MPQKSSQAIIICSTRCGVTTAKREAAYSIPGYGSYTAVQAKYKNAV